MSSNATAATARRITVTAKAAAPGIRFVTTSQGPYSYRVVLHDANAVTEAFAAHDAAHAIQGLDGMTTTWGRDRRTGKLVITVTDETARHAAIVEQEAARAAALEAGRAEVAAARAAAAEEEAMRRPDGCATCSATVPGEACFGCGRITPAVSYGNECETCGEHIADCGEDHPAEPVRPGPSPEAVATAVAQLQAQLTAAAPALGRALEELDAEDAAEAALEASAARIAAAVEALSVLTADELTAVLGDLYEPAAPAAEEAPAARPEDAGVVRVLDERTVPVGLPCYHVTTARGSVYGVAATSTKDALQMVQDRLTGEGSTDLPKQVQRVARWAAAHGTVLQYS